MDNVLCKFKRALTFHPKVDEIKVATRNLCSIPSISRTALANQNVDVIQTSNSKFFAYVDSHNKVYVRAYSNAEFILAEAFELVDFSKLESYRYKSIALNKSNNVIACLTEKGTSIHFYEIIDGKSSLKFNLVAESSEQNSQIKIFRWHPNQTNTILIVSDDNCVLTWNYKNRCDFNLTLIGTPFEVEIVNANWCLNGQYIFVSSKKRVQPPNFNDDLESKIQLFTIDHEKNELKEKYNISEKRNNNVLMLEMDKYGITYLLSLGTKFGITKYCLFELNEVISNFLILKSLS